MGAPHPAPRLTRYDSHPFDGAGDAPRDARCAFCGYPRASILHHPSRVRAAQAVARAAQEQRAKTKDARAR